MPVRDVRSRRLVLERLRAAVAEAGSVAAWGRAHGLTRQYVWDVQCERRLPGPAVLAALGLAVEEHVVEARS